MLPWGPTERANSWRALNGEKVIAGDGFLVRRGGMGAKYYPTIKDQKASLRFQQKQTGLPKLKKAPAGAPAKSGKKK